MKASQRKAMWEKHFNKSWKKFSVGQQMALYKDVYGEDKMKWSFHPVTHVSNLDKNGKKMFNDKGQLMKREWKEIPKHGANSLGIQGRRDLYDHMIKKHKFPKLDRVTK